MLDRHQTLTEGFKSSLIFLLALSAVFLAGKAFVPYTDAHRDVIRDPVQPLQTEPVTNAGVTRPVRLAVVNSNGRYGVQYDDSAADAIFEQLGDLLSGALASAGPPTVIQREEWETALSSTGVYYDFPGIVPLRLLSAWLGEECGSLTAQVTRLILAQPEGASAPLLYYEVSQTGEYYVCSTTVQFRQRLDSFVPNGAFFAFQQPEHYSQLDPDTLILSGTPTPPVYKTGSGINIQDPAVLESLLNTLSFTPQPNAIYPASDGWNVRDGEDSLRLTRSGNIYYHGADQSDRYPVSDDEDGIGVVEATGELVRQVIAPRSGNARIYLDKLEQQADGWTAVYRYSLSGADVQLGEDGWCASFTVSNGQIREYSLKVRRYDPTEETAVLLPEYQAMHAMEAMDAGGRQLLLRYSDSGSGTVLPSWIAR